LALPVPLFLFKLGQGGWGGVQIKREMCSCTVCPQWVLSRGGDRGLSNSVSTILQLTTVVLASSSKVIQTTERKPALYM